MLKTDLGDNEIGNFEEENMRIVSWNCNGRFREKFRDIEKLNADIYIIQECEDPRQSKKADYCHFARNSVWTGRNKNKGIGIFADEGVQIINNNWNSYHLENFISVNVDGKFDLLGVWACNMHIEEYYIYQCIHIDKYNDSTIVIGDFNSNKIWDRKHGDRDHSATVKALEEVGLVSAYHSFYNENQGEETQKTFYLYRHADRGYHIDYCFVRKDRINGYKVLTSEDWLPLSDHVPIILDIDAV